MATLYNNFFGTSFNSSEETYQSTNLIDCLYSYGAANYYKKAVVWNEFSLLGGTVRLWLTDLLFLDDAAWHLDGSQAYGVALVRDFLVSSVPVSGAIWFFMSSLFALVGNRRLQV